MCSSVVDTGQFTACTSGTFSDASFNRLLHVGVALPLGGLLGCAFAFARAPSFPLVGPLPFGHGAFQFLGLIRITSIQTQETGGRMNAL